MWKPKRTAAAKATPPGDVATIADGYPTRRARSSRLDPDSPRPHRAIRARADADARAPAVRPPTAPSASRLGSRRDLRKCCLDAADPREGPMGLVRQPRRAVPRR